MLGEGMNEIKFDIVCRKDSSGRDEWSIFVPVNDAWNGLCLSGNRSSKLVAIREAVGRLGRMIDDLIGEI